MTTPHTDPTPEDAAFLDRQAAKLDPMNGTPRVDGMCSARNEPPNGLIWADDARKLERELAALRSLLRDACWWTAGRKEFDRHGYSLDVREETAFRDVNYRRGYPLYATADEAIDAALANMKEESK